jgi:hypothetical protein
MTAPALQGKDIGTGDPGIGFGTWPIADSSEVAILGTTSDPVDHLGALEGDRDG